MSNRLRYSVALSAVLGLVFAITLYTLEISLGGWEDTLGKLFIFGTIVGLIALPVNIKMWPSIESLAIFFFCTLAATGFSFITLLVIG